MATAPLTPGSDLGLMTSQLFARFIHAYMECGDSVQAVIRDMAAIYNDPTADEDEKSMALATLMEAISPPSYGGRPGLDFDSGDRRDPEFQAASAAMDAEELRFADRLRSVMDEKGVSQSALAEAVGIGHSAVSNILARKSRPQRRTVEKFATALGVSPLDLWPDMPRR